MYNCPICSIPLTEFDMEFNKKLNRSPEMHSAYCFDCTTNKNKDVYRKLKQKEARLKYCIYMLSCFFIGFLDALLYVISEDLLGYSPTISVICAMIGYACILGVIIFSVKLTKAWGKKRDTSSFYTGYHYESEIQRDGTIHTKKVDDYSSGGDSVFESLLKFILD